MRITKVKVGGKTVTFKRDSSLDRSKPLIKPDGSPAAKGKGQIMHADKVADIRDLKEIELKKSVFNSIVRLKLNDNETDSSLGDKLDALTQILKKRLQGEFLYHEDHERSSELLRTYKSITSDDLKKLLTRKGLADLNCNGSKFKLGDEILKSIEGLNNKHSNLGSFFTLTTKWFERALGNKIKYISKSVKENRIAFNLMSLGQYGVSKRKDVINDIVNQLVLSSTAGDAERICKNWADTWAAEYRLDTLLAAIAQVDLFYTDKNNKQQVKKRLNLDYKCLLQQHQSMLFGKNQADTDRNRACKELQFIHNELSKYFELYFPITKKSHKKLQNDVATVQEYVGYYTQPEKIKGTLAAQLTNAAQVHLQELGTLIHYHYNFSTHAWNKKEFKSEDLQLAKIEETLKRKISNDICFAANRLFNQLDFNAIEELFNDLDKEVRNSKRAPKNEQEKANRIEKFAFLKSRLQLGYTIDLLELSGYLEELKSFDLYAAGEDRYIKYKEKYGALKDSSLLKELRRIVSITKSDYLDKELNSLTAILPLNEVERKLLASRKEALYFLRNRIFHVQSVQYTKEGLPNYSELNEELQEDIKQAKAYFTGSLRSNNVLSFYSKATIEQFFKGKPIDLDSRGVAFAPSLKNVLERAYNKFAWDIKVKERTDRENARYYLIHLLYYQYFLPLFVDNVGGIFVKAKELLANANARDLEQAEDKKTGKAYEDLLKIEYINPQQYLAAIQSAETDRDIIQHKEGDGKGKEQPYFQRFIRDLFVAGFETYMNHYKPLIDSQLGELDHRHNEYTGSDGLQKAINDFGPCLEIKLGELNTTDDNILAPILYWYALCSLLDQKRLNSFRNDLLKYEQACEHFNISNKLVLGVKLPHLMTLINLCMLRADVIDWKVYYNNEEEYIAHLKSFLPIENKADLIALEPQNAPEGERQQMYITGDDFITLSGVEKTRLYGTQKVLRQIPNIRLSKDEIVSFYTQEKDAKGANGFLVEKTQLHEKWARGTEPFTESHRRRYIELVEKEEKYLWASNRVNLIHVAKINDLLQDLFSQWISWTYLFERSMYTQMLALKEAKDRNGQRELSTYEPKDDRGKLDEVIVSKEFTDIMAPLLQFDEMTDGKYVVKKTRDRIAHFEYFRSQESSLLELVVDLRKLLSYDRKLKNAVTKSLIDMFDSYGMKLRLHIKHTDDTISVESCEPNKIYHLGSKGKKGKEICSNQVHEEFCKMCVALLELKK